MKMPQTQVEMIHFAGGLDQVTPPLSMKPGLCREAQNFEVGVRGGYKHIDGYERFDGQASPSDAIYYMINATISGTIAQGDTIVGGTSGATGQVIAVEASAVVFTLPTGAFQNGEALKVSGVTQATSTGVAYPSASDSLALHAQYNNLAADVYRAFIAEPTGSGAIIGLKYYDGALYAFRRNGSTVTMYKSTTSGWSAVSFGYEVSFTAGGAVTPADGATLTQGGVTATVSRVVKQSGAWGSSTAAGRFIITAPSGGNFAAGAATLTGGASVTLSGAQSAISLAIGGRFRCINYDFGAGQRMYGCDGVNRAFEFDGTVFVPLTTGMTADTPAHIAAHKNHLFLAFGKSLQHSSIADPYSWSPVTGASEMNLGDTITNIIPQPGDAVSGGAMACFTRNRTFVLYGNSSADWKLITLQQDAGALAHTAQNIGTTYVLDDRGVSNLATTQNFGNFAAASISALIRPYLMQRKTLVLDSCIVREKNQYRLLFENADAIYLTFDNNKPVGFMPIVYNHEMVIAESTELSDGTEAIFYGSADGMVYQSEKGTSADGENIHAFINLVFNSSKMPRVLKQYRKAVLEVSGGGYNQFNISASLSYQSSEVPQIDAATMTAELSTGSWDVGSLDSTVWDGRILTPAEQDLIGVGENIAISIAQTSDTYVPITIHGVLLYFTPRRLMR